MTTSLPLRLAAIFIVGASAIWASSAQAQSCYGTPSRSNVNYEYGRVAFGQFNGASASLVGRRTALALSARVGTIDDLDVQEGALRFGVQLPAGKVQICPALGIGFSRLNTEAAPQTELTSNVLSLRAGVGLGIEQEVYRGISLIPFVAARYEFNVLYVTVDAPNADVVESGDSASVVDVEYGLMASWKMLYAGFVAQRNSDSGDRPYFARYVLGFTFGSGTSRRR